MFEISHGGGRPVSSEIPTLAIPPAGTSARKAYERTMREGTGVPQTTIERLTGTYDYPFKPSVDTSNPSPKRRYSFGDSFGGSSGGSSVSIPSAEQTFDYYEAPLTELYGFNKTTAYQEALANTAYRREMDDMKKAGLNPSVIYGSHSTSGAYSHIYPEVDAPAGSYGSHSSGGSGGSGRRFRGRKSGNYALSGAAYYGIMAAVGTTTALATHNAGVGMAAAGLTGTALKALNGVLRNR